MTTRKITTMALIAGIVLGAAPQRVLTSIDSPMTAGFSKNDSAARLLPTPMSRRTVPIRSKSFRRCTRWITAPSEIPVSLRWKQCTCTKEDI